MDWYFYWIWLSAASVITFLFYGFDKALSKKGGWRIPEAVLHWMVLLGGFPGGWLGRSLFRHKTKKGVFTFVLIISTAIHLALIYWLFFYSR